MNEIANGDREEVTQWYKFIPTCPYYRVSQLSILALTVRWRVPSFFFFPFIFLNSWPASLSLCQNVSLRTPEHNTPVFHFKNMIRLQGDRKNLQIATILPVILASFSTWTISGNTSTHTVSDVSEGGNLSLQWLILQRQPFSSFGLSNILVWYFFMFAIVADSYISVNMAALNYVSQSAEAQFALNFGLLYHSKMHIDLLERA